MLPQPSLPISQPVKSAKFEGGIEPLSPNPAANSDAPSTPSGGENNNDADSGVPDQPGVNILPIPFFFAKLCSPAQVSLYLLLTIY